MARFIFGVDRHQVTLLPSLLDAYVSEDNPVRVIDVLVDELNVRLLGFASMMPAGTGWPGCRPATMLELYRYGYLNQVTSSRRLEREAGRNLELMWLTSHLIPDFMTIAVNSSITFRIRYLRPLWVR